MLLGKFLDVSLVFYLVKIKLDQQFQGYDIWIIFFLVREKYWRHNRITYIDTQMLWNIFFENEYFSANLLNIVPCLLKSMYYCRPYGIALLHIQCMHLGSKCRVAILKKNFFFGYLFAVLQTWITKLKFFLEQRFFRIFLCNPLIFTTVH